MKKITIILILIILMALLFGCINRTPYNNQGEEQEKTVLSVFMTKDEIIEKLGDDYEYETTEDDESNEYNSILKYEGLTIHYYYETKEMPQDLLPQRIELKSNDYTYNFDLELGDDARKIVRYLSTKFDRYFDLSKDDFVFDLFEYREKTRLGSVVDTDYLLKVIYSENNNYTSREDIGEDVTIDAIILFGPS